VATILTGATVAAFHDLLYILPLVCLMVLLLRGWIMGITVRNILRTNAFLRYLTFSCGFLIVFIPARIVIYNTCKGHIMKSCAEETELALSGSVVPLWIGRAFSGLPWEEIGLTFRGDFGAGLAPRGPLDLLSNTWTIIVIALMLSLAVRAGHHLIYKRAHFYSSDTLHKNIASTKPKITERRIGAALIVTGMTLILSSSLLVSVTRRWQESYESGWGIYQFRDTLLVQIGWVFVLFGALYLLFLMLRKFKVLYFLSGITDGSTDLLTHGSRYFTNRPFKILAIACSAAVLFGLTVFTFIANDRYALSSRYDPESNINNLIAVATVDFDNTERGQHIRCQLLDAYTEHWSGSWVTAERLQRELNRLTRSEYGSEFCPTPP